VNVGKSHYESINIAQKLKIMDQGNKIQIKRPEILPINTPAQYYPNHTFNMRLPETHKFSKAMRTSSVLASALNKDYNVEMGDGSFALIKTNIAPGYYDPRPMTSPIELGLFPKSKRRLIGGMDNINYAPGPGSYNVREPNNNKGFIITNAIDDEEPAMSEKKLGPGRYALN